MTSKGPSVDQLPPPPPGHSLLVEGQAAIPFSEGNEVFYNKVQEFNRDLSIHVIKLFAERRLREKTEQALRKTRKVGSDDADWMLPPDTPKLLPWALIPLPPTQQTNAVPVVKSRSIVRHITPFRQSSL